MICPYCNTKAEWISNERIYGKRYGNSYMCYYCPQCGAYVGCHNNSRKPLGTMANAALRKLRQNAHELFDPLWKGKGMGRNKAYKLLQDNTGVAHISQTTPDECYIVIKFLKKYRKINYK